MTIKIPFPIDPEIVAFIRTAVEKTMASWGEHGLALDPIVPLSDSESCSLWMAELGQELRDDCKRLLVILDEKSIEAGYIELEMESAEAITRACSAIRLHLRYKVLKRIPDEILEYGMLDPSKLEVGEHASYFTYIFLAEMQSILISIMDPGSDENPMAGEGNIL